MLASVLVLGGFAGCGKKPETTETQAPLERSPVGTTTVDRDAAGQRASASPLAGSEQLVVVVGKDWDDSSVSLSRFERTGVGAWRQVGDGTAAAIGRAGMAWGIGLHGSGAVAGEAGPAKKEGDGRSPAGAFALGAVFGYDKAPPPGAQISYTRLDASWRCVDDPRSESYNDVIPEPAGGAVDWTSAETMRRTDELYRWVVLVDHNRIRAEGERRAAGVRPTAGAGSCIFLHVWREPGSATVGCAAMDRGALETLITWLDPSRHPATVMLPRAAYEALQAAWQLPPL